MEKLFIGIDVSKDVLDFHGLSEGGEVVIPNGTITNEMSGIRDLINKLRAKRYTGYEVHVCMEHTGHYGYLLIAGLSQASIKLSVINPLEIKNSSGLVRGKNDAVDARRIARYALANRFGLRPYSLPCHEIRQLRALMALREGYVKIAVQLKNSLRALKIAGSTISLKEQIKGHQELIRAQQGAIASLERQMLGIIEGNALLKGSYKKVTSVIGVGPLTGIKCIIETENFTKFGDARKFACHSGLAPFEYQSGSSVKKRTKTSPLRNKGLKAILFKAASSAVQHDPQLRSYYKRKTQQGKHKLSVLNAVANKIVLRIFAVAKRDEPFLKLAA